MAGLEWMLVFDRLDQCASFVRAGLDGAYEVLRAAKTDAEYRNNFRDLTDVIPDNSIRVVLGRGDFVTVRILRLSDGERREALSDRNEQDGICELLSGADPGV